MFQNQGTVSCLKTTLLIFAFEKKNGEISAVERKTSV